MNLDSNRPVPLYLQLKAVLASRIAKGLFPPGTRLPSERQLCDEFGVSRATVREAMRELNREGLIHKVPGYGTFVDTPTIELEVDVSLGGFTKDMRQQGVSPSSQIINAQLIDAPPSELVDRMCLLPQDEVVAVERVRLVNDVPLALHTAYLNHRFCPQLLHYDLAQRSLFSLLREEYDLTLDRADEQVYATLASQRESELLHLSSPAAVLRTERSTYLDAGDIVEFAKATYCGEWYRLHISLDALE